MLTKHKKPIKRIAWIGAAFTPYADNDLNSVADCLHQYVQGLKKLQVHSTLILPPGSQSQHHHIVTKGEMQPTMLIPQNTLTTQSALQNMVDWAWTHQHEFDLIANLGHDYLPHYMVGKFTTPYISLPNMGAASPSLDAFIQQRAREHPKNIWFFSKSHREYLGIPANPLITQSFDLESFPVATDLATPGGFVWAGRLTKKKGIERAIQLARDMGKKLTVAGDKGDGVYLTELMQKYPRSAFMWDYAGNLSRDKLFELFSKSTALLQTQEADWKEAFGRVTAEALLCGCPIIYTDCGANAEIIQRAGGGFMLREEDTPGVLEHTLSLKRREIQEKAKTLFGQISVARKFLEQAQALFYPDPDYRITLLAKEVKPQDCLTA